MTRGKIPLLKVKHAKWKSPSCHFTIASGQHETLTGFMFCPLHSAELCDVASGKTVWWWVMHLPVVVQVVRVWVLSPWERPFSPPAQNIQLHATRLPVARSDCGYRVLRVWGLDLNHQGSGSGLRVLMIRHRSARMVHFIPDHTFAHITPPPPSEINWPGQRFKRVVCINSTQS